MTGVAQSSDAERYTLSAMLMTQAAVWDAAALVAPGDFDDWRHHDIAAAVLSLAGENRPVSPITVVDELARAGSRVEPVYLHSEIVGFATTAANVGYYAGIVAADAQRRRLREAAARVAELASGRDAVAEDVAERARQIIDESTSKLRPSVAPVGERIRQVIDELEAGASDYVETPWRELNRYLTGFKPGALYVIGARPGSGKSIMALMAAAHLARHGAVTFSSLEMDEADLIKRLIAFTGDVFVGALERHDLSESEWRKVAAARSRVSELPLFIDDRSGVSVTQIKAFARTVGRRRKLAGVVVDYLQLIPSADSRKSRWEHVGEITRRLKQTARELRVPVIALSQLNRESEGRQRRLPSLSDLRESGSIEQDADAVLLLQRRVDKDGAETDELDVVVAKNRRGNTGKATLRWEGKFARVSSFPWGHRWSGSEVPDGQDG